VLWQKGARIDSCAMTPGGGRRSLWTGHVRIITSDPTRVASLLAGEVRAIDNVPTNDLAKLAHQQGSGPSTARCRLRLMYLHLDRRATRHPSARQIRTSHFEKNPSSTFACGSPFSNAITASLVDRVDGRPRGRTVHGMPAKFFGYRRS